jgi:thiamine-phosphate pyrophosphorylase
MKKTRIDAGFYFITDSRLSRRGILQDVKAALSAGVKVIQYREKEKDSRGMLEEARKLRRLCKQAVFLVNDRLDICLGCGADGVHLGQGDFPCRLARRILGKKKIIGVSVHNLRQARQAEKGGADYLGVGPIFATATKKDAGPALGAGLIKKIKARTRLPIVAIGGITLRNAPQAIAAGADAVCAISAIARKSSPCVELIRFQQLFARGKA